MEQSSEFQRPETGNPRLSLLTASVMADACCRRPKKRNDGPHEPGIWGMSVEFEVGLETDARTPKRQPQCRFS
jgi:hypothetical protein